jgi:hypothetical protein
MFCSFYFISNFQIPSSPLEWGIYQIQLLFNACGARCDASGFGKVMTSGPALLEVSNKQLIEAGAATSQASK